MHVATPRRTAPCRATGIAACARSATWRLDGTSIALTTEALRCAASRLVSVFQFHQKLSLPVATAVVAAAGFVEKTAWHEQEH